MQITESELFNFRMVEPTHLRGFRVEATTASVLAVLKMSQAILKEIESETMQAKKQGPKSWMAKGEDSPVDEDTWGEKVERRMVPLHGQVSWCPSRKSWCIQYKGAKKNGKEADRWQKWFPVKTKDGRYNVELSRAKFLQKKFEAYQAAVVEWNALDTSSKQRIDVVRAEEVK